MCGILGLYNLNLKKSFLKDNFEKALFTMNYRGPEVFALREFDSNAILGHLRLSIIDLNEESNQPFELDNRYWMVYNGEIYNYIELREELLTAGYSFRTTGDTEVLLRSYQHWGENCVQKFNGMWAFAIYDKETNTLFCSRDRFGVKPFNYSTVNGQFIFSSEIKAILSYFPQLKVPDYNVIANFCRTSIGAQIKNTWFKDIFRLQPAHNLIVDESGLKIYRYWDYPRKVNKRITFNNAVEKYRSLLQESVKLRMRSDVPVGFTLSSGIDSSSIVSLLKDGFNNNINTYTAAFSGTGFQKSEKPNFNSDVEINEPALVKRLTDELGLDPTIVEVSFGNYVEKLKGIIHHLESGHGSPAVFPLNEILEEATKKVTVVIEGQGADELLAGYISNVFPVYFIELLEHLKFSKALKELKYFSRFYSLKSAFKLVIRQSDIKIIKKLHYKFGHDHSLYINKLKKYKEIEDYPNEPKGFDNILNKHLFKAHTGGLVNLLHYGDAISMAHSLESRLPFMDYRLVEFIFTLPSDFKIKNGKGKYIHREAMQGIVPGYIINNPVKFGFDSPLAHLFEKDGEDDAKSILLSNKCINRGIFSKKALEEAFKEQKVGKRDHSRTLYRMLSVELWFREFIDCEGGSNNIRSKGTNKEDFDFLNKISKI
jgi:asparagine synthase (glutamine-hydrolysing)